MNLILFLGAGVSKKSGLPLTGELTEAILRAPPPIAEGYPPDPRLPSGDQLERIQSLLRIMAEGDTRDAKRTAVFRGPTSYEDLFYLCEEMTNWRIGLSDNSILTPFMKALERRARRLLSGDSLDARLNNLGLLASLARLFIQFATTVALRSGEPSGLDLIVELARAERIKQLNIVTLNHDTLVERLLADDGLDLVDGFGAADGDIRWYDDHLYDTSTATVRLFKLHGSVNWYDFHVNGLSRPGLVLRENIGVLADHDGKPLKPWLPNPSFLTGGNKAIRYQHGIYIDLQYRFQELLRRCDVILMCGYGWGDLALNLRLETWLDRPLSKIILLHPNPEEIRERSMIVSSAYDWWVSSGRLVPVPKWMSDLSLADIERLLFDPLSA